MSEHEPPPRGDGPADPRVLTIAGWAIPADEAERLSDDELAERMGADTGLPVDRCRHIVTIVRHGVPDGVDVCGEAWRP